MVIGDAAMGTILYAHGVDSSFDAPVLTHPDLLLNVHDAYIRARAKLIQTRRYGVNYIPLGRYEPDEPVKKTNQQGGQIAKQARQVIAYVIDNIGGIHG